MWCGYAIMQVFRFTDIEVSTLQVWKYKNIHVQENKSKCAGMQIFKCAGMPLCMYASIQICKKVSIKD